MAARSQATSRVPVHVVIGAATIEVWLTHAERRDLLRALEDQRPAHDPVARPSLIVRIERECGGERDRVVPMSLVG